MGKYRPRSVPRIGQKRITLQQKEFEHIAHDLRRRAINTAYGYGLDDAAADDIAQDTLLKMWAMRGEIDPGRHRLPSTRRFPTSSPAMQTPTYC